LSTVGRRGARALSGGVEGYGAEMVLSSGQKIEGGAGRVTREWNVIGSSSQFGQRGDGSNTITTRVVYSSKVGCKKVGRKKN